MAKGEGHNRAKPFAKYFELDAKETELPGGKVGMIHRKKGEGEHSQVAAKVIGPNREAIAAVVADKHAIAYVSVRTAEQVAHRTKRIKLLALGSVPASVENVANGSYPLYWPLNLVTSGEAKGAVKQFIDISYLENSILSLQNIRKDRWGYRAGKTWSWRATQIGVRSHVENDGNV